MPQSPLTDDLAYIRQMAEEGATAPSLSGRYSLLWGSLVTVALITHWATLTGYISIPHNMIGAIWITMAVLGTMGTIIICRLLRDKPGQSSAGNRAESTVWPVMSLGIFLYATATGFAVALRDQPVILFDTIIPVAFTLHAVATSVSVPLFHTKTPWLLVIVSLALAACAMFMVGTSEIYLIAAAGVFLTQIMPAISTIRAEPASVV